MNRRILIITRGNAQLYVKALLILVTFLIMYATSFAAGKPTGEQKFITDTSAVKSKIWSILDTSRVLEVLRYENQVSEASPRVILVVNRMAIVTKEVIESTFDEEHRLLSIKNLTDTTGRFAHGEPVFVGADPVACRENCLNECSDIFSYTYCWYTCVLK